MRGGKPAKSGEPAKGGEPARGGKPARRGQPDRPKPVRRRIVVHGRVQGVFFRDTVRRQANEAGLAGWAQNRSDGTVEAVFEGDPQRVDLMLGFCRQGPGRAEVSQVEVFRERIEGLSGFEVR